MKRLVMTTVLLAAAATSAVAQRVPDMILVHGPGGYSAIGGGLGNFTLTCDTGCSGGQQSSSDLTLMLGRQFSGRWRLELGAHFQRNRSTASDLFTASGGVGIYLFGNLFVRGAATYTRVSVEDTSASFEATGGPGFTVGAGYELFLGDRTALTPYVNFASASLSSVDINAGNNVTGTTAGTVKALNFGITVGRSPRRAGICVAPDGRRVRDSGPNHQAFVACVQEVARWLSQQGRTK